MDSFGLRPIVHYPKYSGALITKSDRQTRCLLLITTNTTVNKLVQINTVVNLSLLVTCI